MADQDLKIRIAAENNASADLKKVGDDISNLQSKAETGNASFGKLAGAFAVGSLAASAASTAFRFVRDGLADCVNQAAEWERGQAQLNAVLTSTQGVAGVTADMANQLAESLSKVTTYTDDEILSAENLALTFTNISSKVFPDATQAILDVSTAMGGDLKGATVQIGKALNDPILGITALTRVGVNFDDQTKKQIKTLVESGKTMDAQKIILAELSKEFGGSAAAAANTYAGRMKMMDNRMGEVKETIGRAMLPGLESLTGGFGEVLTSIEGAIGGAGAFSKVFYGLAQVVKGVLFSVVAFIKIIAAFATVMFDTGKVVTTFAKDAIGNLQKFAQIGKEVFKALSQAMTGDFSGAAETVKEAFKFDFSATQSAFAGVGKSAEGLMNGAFKDLGNAGAAFQESVVQQGFKPVTIASAETANALNKLGGVAKATGSAAKNDLAEKFKQAMKDMKQLSVDTGEKIKETFKDFTKTAADQLDAYNEKVKAINGDIAKTSEDFNRSKLGAEQSYLGERLKLYMSHEDELKSLQDETAKLQKDLGGETDIEKKDVMTAKLAELQASIIKEQSLLKENDDLKKSADELRKKDDFTLLKEKYDAEQAEAKRQFDEKIASLNENLRKESEIYEKQKAELIASTTDKYAKLSVEVNKGWAKMIEDTKFSVDQLKQLESQALAMQASIANATSSIGGTSSNNNDATINVKAFANGGIVTKPTLAMVGEGGESEAIIPLSKLGAMTGGNSNISIMEGATIHVTNEADEKRLASTISRELARIIQTQNSGLASLS